MGDDAMNQRKINRSNHRSNRRLIERFARKSAEAGKLITEKDKQRQTKKLDASDNGHIPMNRLAGSRRTARLRKKRRKAFLGYLENHFPPKFRTSVSQ